MESSRVFILKSIAIAVATVSLLLIALAYSGIFDVRVLLSQFGDNQDNLLGRKVELPESFSEEARSFALKNIETSKAAIQASPKNAEAWLDLAISYKTVGDLDGAVLIWQYLEKEAQNPIAIQNLANTYHLDLKEYKKSEEYYLKSLALEPKNASSYIGLHELYRYSYKQDTTEAVAILTKGLEKVDERGKMALYFAFAGYYKEKSDIKNLISSYEEARVIARELGDTRIVRQIDVELANVRK